MRKIKKTLAFLLTLALCVGMLPTSALAGNKGKVHGRKNEKNSWNQSSQVQMPMEDNAIGENEFTAGESGSNAEVFSAGDETNVGEESSGSAGTFIGDEESAGEITDLNEGESFAGENTTNSEISGSGSEGDTASGQSFEEGTDEVTVVVDAPEGAFPANTIMTVGEASEESVQAIAEAVNVETTDVRAVNITFTVDGEEIQPEVPVKVTLKSDLISNSDKPVIVHVDDNKQTEIVEQVAIDGETVTFETAAFSDWGIADSENDGSEELEGEPSVLSGDDNTDDSKTNYNIIINYIFKDGNIAAQAYTASIASGESFSTSVNNPTVVGYTATEPTGYDTSAVKVVFAETSLSLDVTAISKDIELNVVYVPAEVSYTVEYYQQNVDDDNYTLSDTAYGTGLTGSIVSESYQNQKDKYPGFYGLQFETPAVAADGSTVVEIYYDRNYYMMSFDLGGGYGVEPIYARYGAGVSVGTPTRAGYTFIGWMDENGNTVTTIPETMPAENVTYTASWQAADSAKVTVVFWGENADDEEYSYLKTSQINVKPGTEFTYSEDGTLVCTLEEHTHSIDRGCYERKCGKEEHTHSEACYTCGIENHTHDTSCYSDVGKASSAIIGAPINRSNGYVYRKWSLVGKVIYINGTWYEYTGNTAIGDIAPATCGKTEGTHAHTNECLGCGKAEHIHNIEECYNLTCDKTEHTHGPDCYMSGAGLDSNLWTFVRSDTVTVAADGSSVVNVYYNRTRFTLTFKDGNREVYYLSEKWGANITQHWPIKGTNGTTYNRGERWSPSGSQTYKKVLVHLDIMPAESFILTADRENYDTFIMHYMVEVLPGESGTSYNGKSFKESFKVTANYNYVTKAEDFFDLNGYKQWASNPSFKNGQLDIDGGGDVYFYYTRNSYALTFNDGYNDVESKSVLYEAPLSTYNDYIPKTPSSYEPGSVVFDGWYLNPECSGAKYKLDEHTMPAGNVLLYAKWTPVTHTVKAFKTSSLEKQIGGDITVSHGSMVETKQVPGTPENGNYYFVGWFYVDNGVEKAFDFASMPVTKDMDVYAKWSSNTLVAYTINYKLQDGTAIASSTTGYALAGNSKTFEAKAGEQLDEGYEEGYFPQASSHTIDMSIDDVKNEYTFIYEEAEKVPYTVKYLDANTEENLHEEKIVGDNRKSVVTEYAVTIKGYLPNVFQQRLILSTDGDRDNTLIFYYTKDDEHAIVSVTHNTINLGSTTQYSHKEYTGDIGTDYTESALSIEDYKLSSVTVNGEDVTAADGTLTEELTADGLNIVFNYTAQYYVVYQSDPGNVISKDVVADQNVTTGVHSDHLYGGIYKSENYSDPYTNICGAKFTPIVGTTYYVKEVADTYLLPTQIVTFNRYTKQLYGIYLTTSIDDNKQYKDVGFVISAKYNSGDVYQSITIKAGPNSAFSTQTLGVNDVSKNKTGLVVKLDYLELEGEDYSGIGNSNGTKTIKCYWVTPDGVTVTGCGQRSLTVKDTNEDGIITAAKTTDTTSGQTTPLEVKYVEPKKISSRIIVR